MGPFTCVIACVVRSASQSTVPVVWMAIDHEAFWTGTIVRCASWSWGTVNRPATEVCAPFVLWPSACLIPPHAA